MRSYPSQCGLACLSSDRSSADHSGAVGCVGALLFAFQHSFTNQVPSVFFSQCIFLDLLLFVSMVRLGALLFSARFYSLRFPHPQPPQRGSLWHVPSAVFSSAYFPLLVVLAVSSGAAQVPGRETPRGKHPQPEARVIPCRVIPCAVRSQNRGDFHPLPTEARVTHAVCSGAALLEAGVISMLRGQKWGWSSAS